MFNHKRGIRTQTLDFMIQVYWQTRSSAGTADRIDPKSHSLMHQSICSPDREQSDTFVDAVIFGPMRISVGRLTSGFHLKVNRKHIIFLRTLKLPLCKFFARTHCDRMGPRIECKYACPCPRLVLALSPRLHLVALRLRIVQCFGF